MVASVDLLLREISSPSDDEGSRRTLQKGKEGRHIAVLLRGFDFQRSPAWKAITNNFSSGIRHRELCSVAILIAAKFGVPRVPRDAHRSYPVLIKWFEDNWEAVEPVLPFVCLRDEDDKVINRDRECLDRKMT
jgi:hypothetical protein